MAISFVTVIASFEQIEVGIDMVILETLMDVFREEATTAQDESAWSDMYYFACRTETVQDFQDVLRGQDLSSLSETEIQATVVMLYVLDKQ